MPLPSSRRTRRTHPFWKSGSRPKKILSLIGAAILVGIIFLVAAVAWFSRDLPNPNKLLHRAIPLSTKIYDRTGAHLLYDVHGDEQRTLISVKDIPDDLKWATITAEDRGFYSHNGFDMKGILRALIKDVIQGGKVQGGSTITQQFVKNSLLTSKKTWSRKLKELVISYQIELTFTKDQILQLYFNEIPYGSTAYGAQSAATIYFSKDIHQLTLAESAILAALPKAPTYYSPWGNNRDRLLTRQHKILNDMVGEGYITQDEADVAKKEKIKFTKPGQSISAPHFVMYIKEQLTNTYGEQMVEEGGLKVITTLDYEKQKIAEEAVRAGALKNKAFGASNAALVSLDAHTGEILAMVGSKDYFDESIDGNVNVAIRKRQPGSSFKPFVYAAAFQKGFTPQTIIFDVKTNFDTTGVKPYIPQNYTGQEYGPIAMKKALAGSLNIAAVKTLYLAGVRNVIELAKKLDYQSLGEPDRYGLALVLGGAEVTLLEHVGSYSVFAQEGTVVEPFGIKRIEDKNGIILEEMKEPKKRNVFDPETARQINDALSDNSNRAFVFGTKNHLTLGARPVAAKTGTTNDFRDAWTIGYTPSVVTGVWVGNNNNTAMKRGADGSQIAAPIWNEYMRRTLEGTPMEPFIKPLPVQVNKPMLNGAIGEEEKVKIDKTSGLLATDLTPTEQIEEKIYRKIHTILYYLDKNNPRGSTPEHPEQDPQFLEWERTVREWVEKNKAEEEPPTENDILHTRENTPLVELLAPQENSTITNGWLMTSISTSAARGVQRVEYYLDDQLIDSVFSSPFTISTPLAGTENGFHTLTAKVFDDVGNMGSASVTLNILSSRPHPALKWNTPLNNQTLKVGSKNNLNLSLLVPQGASFDEVRKIVVSYTAQDLSVSGPITTITNPFSPTFTIPWDVLPPSGAYTLIAQAFDRANNIISQKKIIIHIQ